MANRWQHIYDAKPQPIRDWALDELAKELEKELAVWPPRELDWVDVTEEARLKPVLTRPSPPPLETIRVALELSRLELLREVEQIDRFLRSADAKVHLPDSLEEMSALFLSRWLVESCLSIQEATPDKLKRKDLVSLVERLEKRLLRENAPFRL